MKMERKTNRDNGPLSCSALVTMAAQTKTMRVTGPRENQNPWSRAENWGRGKSPDLFRGENWKFRSASMAVFAQKSANQT
jgi:hypothetical protein